MIASTLTRPPDVRRSFTAIFIKLPHAQTRPDVQHPKLQKPPQYYNVNTMSQKPTLSYRLQIVLSMCVISLGCVLAHGHNLPDSPKVAAAVEVSPAYYAQSTTPIAVPSQGTYVPNELIVHFVPGFAPHELDMQIERNHQLAQSLLGRIRLTFESLIDGTSAQTSPQEYATHIAMVDSQFKALEKSRMFDDDSSDMDTSYIVRFAEGVDLENARIAYENLEEVSYVQYNFIYSLQ